MGGAYKSRGHAEDSERRPNPYAYKQRTSVFGDSAEMYVARLLSLMINPNGSVRPDLVSLGDNYKPRLTIELKSGAGRKGTMVWEQLKYPYMIGQDYAQLLGDDSLLESIASEDSIEWDVECPPIHTGEFAYYYGIINRNNSIKTADLNKPFSEIKIDWQDMHLIPYDLGFYSFIVNRAFSTERRNGNEITDEKHMSDLVTVGIEEIKSMMQTDIAGGTALFDRRDSSSIRYDPTLWQNIYMGDFEAIFKGDTQAMKFPKRTKLADLRLNLLTKRYEALPDLKKIAIPGPNGTTIYVLAKPEHEELFRVDVNLTVAYRTPALEQATRERHEALSLLDKIKLRKNVDLFGEEIIDRGNFSCDELSVEETEQLRRLIQWQGSIDETAIHVEQTRIEEDDDLPF